MIRKITGEAPFQVLASNFSIGPSQQGYTLQISADGKNYSNLFTVPANTTRMVTGVANGSFYRLSGNNSEVSINWITQCSDGGGGGSTPVDPVDPTLLKASQSTPQGVEAGDVYAKPNGTEKMTYNTFQLYRLSCSRNLAQYTGNGRIADMTVTDGHGWSLRYYRSEGTSGDEMLQYIVDGAVKQEFNLSTYEPTGTDVFFDYTLPGIGFRVLSRNVANQAQLYLYTPYNDPAPTITYTDGPNAGGKPNINPQIRYIDVTVDVPTYDVFQAGGTVEKFYATITGEGSYNNVIDTANVFWLDAGRSNKMVITFNDMTAGKFLSFVQNVNDEMFTYAASDENGHPFSIEVYDPNSTLLFTIPEGKSTQVLGGEPTYYSFSGNVLTISREYGGNFINWTNSSIGYGLGEEKLVKADDVEGKLLPDADPNYGLVLQYNSEPEWVHLSNLTALQLINIQTEGEQNNYPTFLARTDSQEFRWKKMSVLEAVTDDGIPSGAKNGAVWAYAQKGQSVGWKSYDGGSYNKMRINSTTVSLFFYYGTENVNIEFAGTGMTVNGNLWLPVAGKFSGTTAGGLGITGQTADGYFYCETDSDVSNISMQPSFLTLEVRGKEIPESYGIKQYQGLSATETEWISKDDIPKDREYGIYDFRVDITDPNTYAQIDFDIKGCTNNLTWADGAWKSSLISLIDDGNGVYTGSSVCGWNVSAWTSGSYFYVSCDYSMEDGINIYNDGDWEVEVPKPVAANVVTSVDIKRMVKISQADYDALVQAGTVDAKTFYIIV